MGLGLKKDKKEKEEPRDELVGRLYEADAAKVHYWGTYHSGPILRSVTNKDGKLEKGGLTSNTLYYIVRAAHWKGDPMPQETD